jgi:hypothetical protein
MHITILKVEKVTRDTVDIRFTRRGGGCPNWQGILDDSRSLMVAFGEATGNRALFLDGEKSLGRGARVRLTRHVYLAVRIALEHHHAAKPALAAQRLMIDDAEVVTPLLLKTARESLPKLRRWRRIVNELDLCTL